MLVVWECATRSADMRVALPELLRRWIVGSVLSGDISVKTYFDYSLGACADRLEARSI